MSAACALHAHALARDPTPEVAEMRRLACAAPAVPLLAWMHGKSWERAVMNTASIAVDVMAMVWLL